tara:strand:- start:78 stop:230 length:153 start_codon:yes stop_codon:yes gene_type:complete
MVAVRGQLYMSASSPNMSPAAKVLTNCCSDEPAGLTCMVKRSEIGEFGGV